jgi:predicted RNA binding protein YcfA (HicA-like mRNA interferase family)
LPKQYPPLTPEEVLAILKVQGFTLDNTVGSHANHVGYTNDIKRRVTVDLKIKGYSPELMKSMIRQSGLSREDFYCSTKKTAVKINMRKKVIKTEIAPK